MKGGTITAVVAVPAVAVGGLVALVMDQDDAATLAASNQTAVVMAQAALSSCFDGTAAAGGVSGAGGGGVDVALQSTPGGFGRWSAAQVQNAREIAVEGMRAGVGAWGVTVGLATAMQESQLTDIAGGDRDSVGVFQGRPSQGWGTPAQLQNTSFSAKSFYGVNPAVKNPGLTDISGWEKLPLTRAAQKVQRSAFPDAYAKYESQARALTDHLLKGASAAPKAVSNATYPTAQDVPAKASGGPHTQLVGLNQGRPWLKNRLIALGNQLRKQGIRVGEHPAFGGVHPVHGYKSLHDYGLAIDIHSDTGGETNGQFDRLARSLWSQGFGVQWKSENHYDHMHVDVGLIGRMFGQTAWIKNPNSGKLGATGAQPLNIEGGAAGQTSVVTNANVNCSRNQKAQISNVTGGAGGASAAGAVSGAWANPMGSASYQSVSRFGMRFHPIRKRWQLHDGVDLAAPTGTPVVAACTGTVEYVGAWSSSAGNTVTVDCGGGVKTRYLHLSSFNTKVGAKVTAGKGVIAKVGATGGVTGPHLHFTVLKNGSTKPNSGTPVDPVPYMKGRRITL